jgi:hypothetical protein
MSFGNVVATVRHHIAKSQQMDLLRKVINMNLLSFIHILFRPKQGFGYLGSCWCQMDGANKMPS